jgi:hypothetical protein
MANYRLETDSKWNDSKWKMPISYLDKDGNQTNRQANDKQMVDMADSSYGDHHNTSP